MLKPFWSKKRKIKATGGELEAALGKAAKLPETKPEDAGKVLVIDAEGNIIVKED